jgi:hypothetical protein
MKFDPFFLSVFLEKKRLTPFEKGNQIMSLGGGVSWTRGYRDYFISNFFWAIKIFVQQKIMIKF